MSAGLSSRPGHNDTLMQTHQPGIFDGDVLYFTAALDDPWLNRGIDSWACARERGYRESPGRVHALGHHLARRSRDRLVR